MKIYQVILFPMAKPTAKILDWWLGPESIMLFRERDFRALITKHVEAGSADVGRLEGTGALNFLDLDDLAVLDEGEPVDPRSVIHLPVPHERPILPKFERSQNDPFLRQVNASGKKWVIITDACGHPFLVLDAHHFLRGALLGGPSFNPEAHWHRPIIVTDMRTRLGDVIGALEGQAAKSRRRRHRPRLDSGLGKTEAHYHRGRPPGAALARDRDERRKTALSQFMGRMIWDLGKRR